MKHKRHYTITTLSDYRRNISDKLYYYVHGWNNVSDKINKYAYKANTKTLYKWSDKYIIRSVCDDFWCRDNFKRHKYRLYSGMMSDLGAEYEKVDSSMSYYYKRMIMKIFFMNKIDPIGL